MPGGNAAFFGIVTPYLIVRGIDQRFNSKDHTAPVVFGIMLAQILQDYPGLGDFRKLTTDEIVYFYDYLRPALRGKSKPKK